MPLPVKPAETPTWASSAVNVTTPPAGKKTDGWLAADVPPPNWQNWLHYWTEQWRAWSEDGLDDHELRIASRETATYTIPMTGNYEPLAGVSTLGGTPLTTAAGNALQVGLSGFDKGPTLQITEIRWRINQVGAGTVNVTLWEIDETINAPGSVVTTVNSGAGTGDKYVTLPALNRPLTPGYSWYLRADHVGASTVIRYGPIEIDFDFI